MAQPVTTKKEFYRRWVAGEFGNRLRNWDNLADIPSDYTGRIGIRNKTPNSPYCRYDLELNEVPEAIDEFIAQGCERSTMTFGEAAPDQHITFQGEFLQDELHYSLQYSLEKTQMRTALRNSSCWVNGIVAQQLLVHFCDDASYQDLMYLINNYPDHMIELSCYDICLGNIPHRNTLIWEVRKY